MECHIVVCLAVLQQPHYLDFRSEIKYSFAEITKTHTVPKRLSYISPRHFSTLICEAECSSRTDESMGPSVHSLIPRYLRQKGEEN